MNLIELKADFTTLVTTHMTGLKLAPITIERSKEMMELVKPYIDYNNYDQETLTNTFAYMHANADALIANNQTVVDGVIYPAETSEELYRQVLIDTAELLASVPEEVASAVAISVTISGEVMFEQLEAA